MNDVDFKRILSRYVVGFASALVFSVVSYLIATNGWLGAPAATMAILLLLAALQLVVQLVCFLHLGINDRSVSRTAIFAFVMTMMLVIVIGSIWIMKNLDYRMQMSSDAMTEYMEKQNRKGF